MSDNETLAMMVADVASRSAAGTTSSMMLEGAPPKWLEGKSREQRAIAFAEVQRIIDVVGGIGVINTYAMHAFNQTTDEIWRIKDSVVDQDRKAVMEGFAAALTANTREGMLSAVTKGRNQLITLIDTRFTPDEQRGILARIFGPR